MTYPQNYTPPPPPKPKIRSTQSDTVPLPKNEVNEWHDITTMDDHLNDFEKEKYTDSHFKTKQRKKTAREISLHFKKHGFFKKLMLKLKIAKEVKK